MKYHELIHYILNCATWHSRKYSQ